MDRETSLLERLSASAVNFGLGLAITGAAIKGYGIMNNSQNASDYANYPIYAGAALILSGLVSGVMSARPTETNEGEYN